MEIDCTDELLPVYQSRNFDFHHLDVTVYPFCQTVADLWHDRIDEELDWFVDRVSSASTVPQMPVRDLFH